MFLSFSYVYFICIMVEGKKICSCSRSFNTISHSFESNFLLFPTISITRLLFCRPQATPLPILPIPSAPQLQWQLTSMTLFIHFGPNTLRDSEWGTGEADPSLFNPTSLNTTQWVQVAKDAGFNRVMLTAVLFMA